MKWSTLTSNRAACSSELIRISPLRQQLNMAQSAPKLSGVFGPVSRTATVSPWSCIHTCMSAQCLVYFESSVSSQRGRGKPTRLSGSDGVTLSAATQSILMKIHRAKYTRFENLLHLQTVGGFLRAFGEQRLVDS